MKFFGVVLIALGSCLAEQGAGPELPEPFTPQPGSGAGGVPGGGNSGGDIVPNVIAGWEVDPPFSKPWMVTLWYDGDFFCAGALIDPNWVLTAAQCVYEYTDKELHLPYWVVEFPRHDISLSADAENAYEMVPKEICVHKYFDPNTKWNDLALIKLPKTVTKFPHLLLPDEEDLHIYDPFYVLGWGLETDVDYSDVLREALVEHEDCGFPATSTFEAYDDLSYDHQKQLFCGAGEPPGDPFPDACYGDQGSPLVMPDDDPETDDYYIIGVASLIPEVCGRGIDTGYQDVLHQIGWIRYKIFDEDFICPFEEITCGSYKYGDTSLEYDIFDTLAGDKFYTLTLPGTEPYNVSIDACASEYDSWIYITELYNFKIIICENDDGKYCIDDESSIMDCELEPGQYSVIVSGFRFEEGPFQIDVSCDTCFSDYVSYDITGISRILVGSVEECCDLCDADAACEKFSFKNTNGACYLLPDATLLPKQSNAYMSSKTPPPPNESTGRWIGTHYAKMGFKSSEDCGHYCDMDNQYHEGRCGQWHFDNYKQKCYLFLSVTGNDPLDPRYEKGWIEFPI